MGVLSTLRLPDSLTESSIKQLLDQLTTLYVSHRTRISRTIYICLFLALITRIRNLIKEQRAAIARQVETRGRHSLDTNTNASGNPKKRVELNREFFRNLVRLLKICVPGWKSKELRLLISHSVFLVLRTLISLYVAELDGRLVSSLVRGKGRKFLSGLVWWMIVAVPATFTNSMVCIFSYPCCIPANGINSFHSIKQNLHCSTALVSHSISMPSTCPI